MPQTVLLERPENDLLEFAFAALCLARHAIISWDVIVTSHLSYVWSVTASTVTKRRRDIFVAARQNNNKNALKIQGRLCIDLRHWMNLKDHFRTTDCGAKTVAAVIEKT